VGVSRESKADERRERGQEVGRRDDLGALGDGPLRDLHRRRVHVVLPPHGDRPRPEPRGVNGGRENVRRSDAAERQHRVALAESSEQKFQRPDLVAT
jgi:hypothetical protein